MRDKDINKFKSLRDSDIVKLYHEGDNRALEYLLYKYNKYIHKIANAYYKRTNLEDEDIFSYATLGFLEGVNKYDTSTDNYFMYFTGMWSKVKILWAIDTYNTVIRVPVNRLKEMRKVKSSLETLQNNNAEISIENISLISGISKEKVLEYMSNEDYILKDLKKVDFFYSDSNIYNIFDSNDLKHDLKKILDTFTSTEQYIVNHSFGLFEYPKIDNIEIGEYLNISSERVRQIKDRCIRRLRHSSYASILNQYLD